MATVTVMTAERMQEIEDGAVVGAALVDDHLIMERHDGSTFDAGLIHVGVGSSTQIVIASSEANENSIATADLVCDGVHDEEQIFAAIEMLYSDTWGQSGKIILTEGTFYCDLTGDLDNPAYTIEPSYITIEGMGTSNTLLEITHPDGQAMIFTDGQLKNLAIQNVTDGQTLIEMIGNSLLDNVVVNIANSENCIGVWLYSVEGIIRNSTISVGPDGCTGIDLTRGQVYNNQFTSIGGLGINVLSQEVYTDPEFKSRIINNTFEGSNENTHIYINNPVPGNLSYANCLITENQFDCTDSDFAIFCVEMDSSSMSSLRIVNNKFQDYVLDKVAISLNGVGTAFIDSNKFIGFETAIDLTECWDAKVTNNQLQGPKYPIVALNCHRINIVNNFFHGFIDPGTVFTAVTGQIGILATGCQQAFIIGNQMNVIGQEGMIVTTCTESYIGQNFLHRCGLLTDNTHDGIKLITSDDCSILDNRMTNTSPATQLRYGINIGSGCDRTYVRGNHILPGTAQTAPILDSGTSTDTTSANKIT